MCSPFRSRRRGSSRELKRGNSIRELAYNNPRGSKCPGTRTNLLLITFLLLKEEGSGNVFLATSATEILLEKCLTVRQA